MYPFAPRSMMRALVCLLANPAKPAQRLHMSTATSPASSKQDYNDTLAGLFKVAKTASRHNPLKQGTEEVFNKRFDFFKQEIAELQRQSGQKMKVIHVAGSKGKGSTLEYIASSLRNSGYKVGTFTSPHLHTARERFKIGRKLISTEDFIKYGQDTIEVMRDQNWVVFFDLLFYMGIRYFAHQRVDYLLLETGVGGRYDSTNAFDEVEVAVITHISLDHQGILGDTIEEIASQKAGIVKHGATVFTTAAQRESVMQVIAEECVLKDAQLHTVEPSMKQLVDEVGLTPKCDTQVCVYTIIYHRFSVRMWVCRCGWMD